MMWQEYLARMAETRGCAEICVTIENFPPDWAPQLLGVLREAELRAEREAEAGL